MRRQALLRMLMIALFTSVGLAFQAGTDGPYKVLKTVKVGGDEAGIKNASNYKTSKGDEAATRSFGMGVVSHTIQGKTEFAAWSFDVKLEGKNAIRHLDLTLHNNS